MPQKHSKKQSKDIFVPAQSNPNFQRAKKKGLKARTNEAKGKKYNTKKK